MLLFCGAKLNVLEIILDPENDDEEEEMFINVNKECPYRVTSNVAHLLELIKTVNSNSQIKPLLLCVQKMFAILLRKLKERRVERSSDDEEDDEDVNESRRLISSQSVIELDGFEVRLSETKPASIDFEWLREKLTRINFKSLEPVLGSSIRFETDENFAEASEFYAEFFTIGDTQNTNKTMVFLVEKLAACVLVTHDELNCVEIVECINELVLKLIDSSQFALASYLVVETCARRIELEIDLIEAARVRAELRAGTNEKLTGNLFFMSELYSRRVTRLVDIVERLASTVSSKRETCVLVSVLSRVFYLITKLLIRKITRFDALVDVAHLNLDALFKTCFQLGVKSIKVKKKKKLFSKYYLYLFIS